MTEETESMVLELLRRMREENREEFTELKLRVSALEQALSQGLSGLQAQMGQILVSMGSFHRRADRLDMRTDSFKSRPERLEGKSNDIDVLFARIEERLKTTDA
jgi:hypothetical protein